jgi:hypothetical protein
MVYRMGVEEMTHTREAPVFHPLTEESEFVVEARESLQEDSRARVTTAQLRGSLRGRGRGRPLIRPKCIYFPEHFCYCFSSNLCVLNATNTN